MKRLVVLLSIIGVFFGCQLRLSESSVKADRYAENVQIKKFLAAGLSRVLNNYPTDQIRGFLKEGPHDQSYCADITTAYGLLEGLGYGIIYVVAPENNLYKYGSDFSKKLSKISLEYFEISENCTSKIKEHDEISRQLEASRVKLKTLYNLVKSDSDKLEEDSKK